MTVINTNVKSLIAQASLAANNKNLSTAMERLSTGSRINSAKDDAAGLAISSRMTSQVRGLNMAIRNANDGISLAQTAEGAMEETTSMLQRMRELSLQAANSVNNASDRAALDAEVQQLKAEIDRIAGTTTFNNQNILDGSFSGVLQIGDKASQTMAITVGAVTTTSMGATAQGEAVGNSLASLQVGGASRVASDYQGLSFSVAVDGVSRTVTLPVPTSSVSNVSGASAVVVPTAADRTVDLSSSAQIGGVQQQTLDLSTGNAEDAVLRISVNGNASQDIDISDTSYYVDEGAATGAEVVAALQAELDGNAAFQGANAVTVSIRDNGLIEFAMANGGDGLITLTQDDTDAALLERITGAVVADAATASATGTLTIGAVTASFSGQTSFDIGENHFDLGASIAAHGYSTAALTADQFATVYNETAVVDGVSVSSVSVSAEGYLTFTGGLPETPSASSPYTTGDLSTILTIPDGSTVDSTLFDDLTPGAVFGENTITVTASSNDELSIQVGSSTAVAITIEPDEYLTMADLAAEIQTKLDANGALTGDNAVTVTATMNADNEMGLTFTNAGGQAMVISGSFVTTDDDGSDSISAGLSSTNIGASTLVSGDVSLDADNIPTIASSTDPVTVGNSVLSARTIDLSGTDELTFSANVNGQGAVDLDLADAITALDLDSSALTGEDLVAALNYTFDSNGSFAGNNAVVASLGSSGHIEFQVQGAPASGGNPSLVIDDATGGTINTLEAMLLANGNLDGDATPQVSTYAFTADTTTSAADGNITVFGVSVAILSTDTDAGVATKVYTALNASDTFMARVSSITDDAAGTLTVNWKATEETVAVDFADTGTTDVTVTDTDTTAYAAATVASTLTSDTSGNLVARNAADDGELFGITDLEITTGSNDTLTITVGSGNPVNVTLDAGTYSNAADLVEQINTQLADLGVFTGDDALTFTVSTDSDGAEGFAVTSATGEAVEVDGTFITDGLGASAAVTFPGVVEPTGGVNLTTDAGVTMSVTDSAGSVFTRTFNLGGSDANTSFADYASLIESGANQAFSDAGFTFTASYANGEFSLTADQADASGVLLSGSSVTAAFGSDVLGSAPVVEVAASRFGSMGDVAAAINNDLGDAAVASFDSVSGTWSFTSISGLPGANSTIELSGSGLANVQIGGTLSASGATGNATASRLSDISITTVDDANAAIASIDNAIEYVNSQRAYLGAIQNRLDHTVSNLTNIATNTEASRSRIMDADYGAESANLAKAQIIQQAATAMLAQANQSAQSVLSLLQ